MRCRTHILLVRNYTDTALSQGVFHDNKLYVHACRQPPQVRVEPADQTNLPQPPAARRTICVSFTPLEKPHLPARERNDELKRASKQEREQLQLQVPVEGSPYISGHGLLFT